MSINTNDWKALYNWILNMISQTNLYIQKKNILLANQVLQVAIQKCKRMVLIHKDYSCYLIYGSALIEKAKLSRTEERENLYTKACKKFEKAISLFKLNDGNENKQFSLYYNSGNSYLYLSNHFLKTTKGNEKKIDQYFQKAAEKFEQAFKIKPNSANSYQNYAACKK